MSSTSKIAMMDMTKPQSKLMTVVEMAGWGFTQIEWVDMDADGVKDCVTIRAQSSAGAGYFDDQN